jgi:hypothetical protein
VIDQSVRLPPGVQSLFERIENEFGLDGTAHAPSDDHARVDIDHEGVEHEALPCGHISEVRHPQFVRSRGDELTVDKIR